VLIKQLEVFVDLELRSCQSFLVWLKLGRQIVELGGNVIVSELLDAKLLAPESVVDSLGELNILSDLLECLLDDLLLDKHAAEFQVLPACHRGNVIQLFLRDLISISIGIILVV
jgi:hypothetical protein